MASLWQFSVVLVLGGLMVVMTITLVFCVEACFGVRPKITPHSWDQWKSMRSFQKIRALMLWAILYNSVSLGGMVFSRGVEPGLIGPALCLSVLVSLLIIRDRAVSR